MLHVVARIELAPGARAAFLDEFRRVEPLVRAEEGCLEYTGVVDAETRIPAQVPVGEDVVLVVEKWMTEGALAAHLAAAHMAGFHERTAGLVARSTVHVLRALAEPA